ncbi:deoxyribodipyrimidine photo-lyase [Thaumasiovibrio subtropicus]|uniref:deoxyribodipyrimidine photo-lyase n=1 Tax=Thaumasiovibrio subtropicus TaxID=1891207 RepID=UPI000B351BE4|nr:deoxyribodipyrimidine photo-lyase [Thaumasiovibrio subtropicus]
MSNAPIIVWFRRDLRVADNTALSKAAERQQPIIGLFVETPGQWRAHQMAPIQADLIERRLVVLRKKLNSLGIPLLVTQCDDFAATPSLVEKVCTEFNASAVLCNKEYQLNEMQRDYQVANALKGVGVQMQVYDDSCILAPGTVLNGHGEPYKVFTPFRKSWLRVLNSYGAQAMPRPTPSPQFYPLQGDTQQVEPITFASEKIPSDAYPVDDGAISSRLQQFCDESVHQYHEKRDYPAVDGTSMLSPYLAIGALSARQCFAMLMAAAPDCIDNPKSGGFSWLNELVWREFYNHLLYAYPRLCRHQAFTPWSEAVRWEKNSAALSAWQAGKTGYPIVDAAMRQLNETGWMHNRLRMIVASFLTKDLFIDWRQGEAYFMSKLVDGDFAANNGGWQWAASTGTDAQPYFRIFNPTTQGKRFDPNGDFIRKWVKELENCPETLIHEPHLWAGVGNTAYPAPIVDHGEARTIAISRFQLAKEQAVPSGSEI